MVPLLSWTQYPRTPKVMVPLVPPAESEALRKYTNLNHGTEKETMARRMVASKVTIKPGVAGLIWEVSSR